MSDHPLAGGDDTPLARQFRRIMRRAQRQADAERADESGTDRWARENAEQDERGPWAGS